MRFQDIVDAVTKASPLQDKALRPYLAGRDKVFWERAEGFTRTYGTWMASKGWGAADMAGAYNRMCAEFVSEQMKFLRTGRYSCRSLEEAQRTVYQDGERMRTYMLGLALSQFLWPNHYAILDFYLRFLRSQAPRVTRHLEVGAGHGLFLIEALRQTPRARHSVVDLSPTSLDLSRELCTQEGLTHPSFQLADFLDLPADGGHDLVVMGEVLEHTEKPVELLEKLRSVLARDGRAFVTTCSNCPAIDHIAQFESLDEIRSLMSTCGFTILEELALPVDERGEQDPDSGLPQLGHNWAGVLS
ncbi:MAG: class I SAM-dependent methyltransferase [Planctomycetota bacterium]